MGNQKQPTNEQKQQAKAIVDELLGRFDVALGRGIRKKIVLALITLGVYVVYVASGFKFPHA